jgi:hypothetical protein
MPRAVPRRSLLRTPLAWGTRSALLAVMVKVLLALLKPALLLLVLVLVLALVLPVLVLLLASPLGAGRWMSPRHSPSRQQRSSPSLAPCSAAEAW